MALVSHRNVVTSKSMSLGWCLKITTRTPNLMSVGQLVNVERKDRQHSNLNFSLAKGKSAVVIIYFFIKECMWQYKLSTSESKNMRGNGIVNLIST